MPYNFAADSFHTGNFVADFLQAKCDFRGKTAILRFRAPFEGLTGQLVKQCKDVKMMILGSLESA